jgi:hypothetical protein
MKLQAQLVYIVNTESDAPFFKNESIDLIFKTTAYSPEFLCISLDKSRLDNVSYGLGEIHLFTRKTTRLKSRIHAIQKRKEWKISISREDTFQGIYGCIVSPNPSKLRPFIQRKPSY